jgi:glycosyltransferase involved in cell wall biosynthesis
MPNFVDTEIFRPAASDAEKAACREKLGIPPDALVIGTAATVKRPHKRIDWLVREFAALLKRPQTTDHRPQTGRGEGGDGQLERHGPQGLRSAVCGLQSSPFLAIAGARTAESGDIADTARGLCGERVKFFLDLPRDRMPDFYRALDVFVLVSLFEMMPIAVLEALGSGLPVVANRHPVLEWMVGEESRPQTADRRPHTADHRPQTADRRPQITDCGQETEDRELCGGVCIDMGRDGALAGFLGALDAGWTRARAAGARNRALAMFSKERVAEQYVRYYERVIAA